MEGYCVFDENENIIFVNPQTSRLKIKNIIFICSDSELKEEQRKKKSNG